ncbi:Imidazolonepropionase [Streptomyces hirsutus]
MDLVTGRMLDACAPHARWIDVFCERGAFDGDQARAVLTAGRARGLHPRVHANQLTHGPGVQLAVELDAASADHCTHLTDADVDALADSRTVATLLPGAEFSTRAAWPDAARLLDAGVTVALSTDCNPGSSFTSSVPFCVALAVRDMGMTPDEALWSATAGGAAALRRTDVGRLAPGARADLVLPHAPSHVHLAYRPGVPPGHGRVAARCPRCSTRGTQVPARAASDLSALAAPSPRDDASRSRPPSPRLIRCDAPGRDHSTGVDARKRARFVSIGGLVHRRSHLFQTPTASGPPRSRLVSGSSRGRL